MFRYFQKAREPMNSYTHFLGMIFSVVATIFMILLDCTKGVVTWQTMTAIVVFGISMLALYTASSVYHYYNGPQKIQDILRKLDHSMIYVLIAGTYTPICVKFMPGNQGLIFSIFIWTFALAGILIKTCWMNAPRWLYTSVYILMGWAIVFDWKALAALPVGAFCLLLAGGLSYTIGAVFYILKKPNLSEKFGFHELFHVCILLGSILHFLTVVLYVIL